MLIDRWLNLNVFPPFLHQVGDRDHEFWRVAVFAPMWFFGGGLLGYLTLEITRNFAFELARLVPPQVGRLIATPLGFVHLDQILGNVGLIGEARRTLELAAGPAAVAVAVPVAGWLLMHRSPRSWYTSAPRFRWRLLVVGMGLFCLVTGLTMLADGLVHGFPKSPPLLRSDERMSARLIYFAITLLALTAAAAAEEVVTRGWMMQQTAVFTHNLVLIVSVNAAAFAFIHLDPDPLRNVALFASGVSLSLIAIRTGGLEFGIGVHAANNLMLVWFSQPLDLERAGTRMNWADLAIQLAVTFSGLALAELTLRQPRLRRWSRISV
jgi:membrane protease YdiL (CAAX protease family)